MRGRWLQIVLSCLIIIVALEARFLDPALLQNMRLKSFDLYQELKPREYKPVPARFIDLDDESLARLGQWPWPRTRVAALVDRLKQAGAAAIALDIVFSEPDRTSPRQIVELWPNTPETELLRQTISALPDHDEVLAQTIGRAGNVVVGFAATGKAGAGAMPTLKAGMSWAGHDPLEFVHTYSGAVVGLPGIDAAGAGTAGIGMKSEHDGILRRFPLLISYGGTLYPTLPAESLRVAQGAANYLIKSSGASGVISFGARTGIVAVRVGRFTVPTDNEGRVWLYDSGPVPERRVAAWQIMEGEFEPALIAGNIVVVGTSAAGLGDLHATPLAATMSGSEAQLQVIEQMLTGEFLQRPDWAKGAELAMLLVIGLVVNIATARLGAGLSATVTAGMLAGALGLSWYLFINEGFLLDPIYPAVTSVMVYLGASLMAYLRTEHERKHIREAFSHYMSPDMVKRLADDPAQLRLGGETRELTLLFSDLRGFTSISEKYDAEGLTSLVNRFLTPMTEVTLNHGGTVDKYMGDAMMAFWNAPLDDEDHVRNAALTALDLRRCLAPLNAELEAEAKEQEIEFTPLKIGIGVNTGNACVGNMGSEQRFDYSALGDEVNLASRLEGMSKQYGVDIVISGSTRDKVPDFTALELDRVKVVGKTIPVTVHTLLGDETLGQDPEFQHGLESHNAMLQAYRAQEWDRAAELVAECRSRFEDKQGMKKYYDLMDQRIAELRANPPGPDWDGVAEATSK
ncbi:MAG: adenylate/guanylate cyclase domain-containing protein [Alphaproteobacteria bacterium]|nr:adenylate/guanylate cyclase domain-containing protein [Alphaproteobacteria bacterium]